MIRKLLLFLFLLAWLPGGVCARIVFADLQNSKLEEWGSPQSDNDGQRFTTQNGVSYTYWVPGNTELGKNNWYGFSLWEIPVDELKFDAKLDEDITVVADAQYTKHPFQVSVSLVYKNEGPDDHLGNDVEIPTTANSKGLYIATVKLNDLLKLRKGKDLNQYKSLAIRLVRQRQSDDDYGHITIRQVYLHQNTKTNEFTYDPVNGSHYVDLNSDAWSAWGCVSISNDNAGNMLVTVAPKKDASGNVYKDDAGSPRVLGGLVLDIGQRDFSQVLRVQMNQTYGNVDNVYVTKTGEPTTKIGDSSSGRLLNYLDVAKADGTDINNNGKFWYSQYDFRYIHYQQESKEMSYMEWSADWPYGNSEKTTHLPTTFSDQTMTISQFLITYDVFRSEPWHEASLRNAPLYSVDGNNNVTIDNEHFNYTTGLKVTGSSTSNRLIYGSNVGLFGSRYADVKGIDQIKIYATDGLTFEAVFDLEPNSWANSQTVQSKKAGKVPDSYKNTYQGKNDTNQYYVYTIDVPHDVSRLHILKLTDGTGTVDNVTLYSATSPIDYYVSGQMGSIESSSAVTAALSNPLAMNIDATDLRNGSDNKIALNSANKNCLVYVKDKAQVSNIDNVVVRSGTYPDYTYSADNIVLTDAVYSYMTGNNKDISSYHYPFYAPYDITAAQVTYTGYTGKYGTVCLPFSYGPSNVNVASGSTAPSFYTTQGAMNYDPKLGHYVVNATLVQSGNLAANQPALIVNPNKAAVSYTVSAKSVKVSHTAASDLNITDPADNSKTDDTKEESELYQGNLQGVYSMRHPQVGGYVLQQQTGDKTVMFHKVVDNKPTLTQFRSYLVLPSTSKAKAQNVIGINFLDGETDATAIESATVHNDASKIVARYNAVGERISVPVHGLNVVVMADGSVKKIIVK